MLWALQRQLVYFPDATPVPPAAEVIAGSRDVTLHTTDGLELGAWFVPATGGADTGMAVLVAPGNGGNRAGRAELAERLSERGLAVLLMDYRGYGGNPGSPSEEGLAADADAAARALEELGYPAGAHHLLRGVAGHRCGGGAAGGAATRGRGAPVTVHRSGGRRGPTTTRGCRCGRCSVTGSRSWSTSASSDVPVTVIYGDRDSVVPSAAQCPGGRRRPSLAERVVLPGADHNDPVMFGPQVADAVARLAEQVS